METILDKLRKLNYNLLDKGNLTNFLLSGAAITPILSIPGQVLGLALGKNCMWCRIINGTVFYRRYIMDKRYLQTSTMVELYIQSCLDCGAPIDRKIIEKLKHKKNEFDITDIHWGK